MHIDRRECNWWLIVKGLSAHFRYFWSIKVVHFSSYRLSCWFPIVKHYNSQIDHLETVLKKMRLVPNYQINIYELISVCSCPGNMRMISETAYSSQTKLIGLNHPIGEHGIGYSNLTPDPQGARGAPGGQNSSFTKSKNFANKSCQAW